MQSTDLMLVEYDDTQPELMERIADHWQKMMTITKSEKVKAKILLEWRAGHTTLYFYKEVFECLKEMNSNGELSK
ncbi:MAG: hypothetical protein KAR39_11550 [Thermoplasmata archaeon]|nr:hypothetical protein [Thermoplasmata archaeon]